MANMKRTRSGYMLDTNIFNHLLDGKIPLEKIRNLNGPIYYTHVQHDEILSTKDNFRRDALLEIFTKVLKTDIPTESTVIGVSRIGKSKIPGHKLGTETAVWDVSRWGEAKWGTYGLYESIKIALKTNKMSNIRDALIAETAIANKLILVTNDRNLMNVVNKLGGKSVGL